MKTYKTIFLIIVASILLMAFTSCMPNPDQELTRAPSGFFKGVWHGWIAPISLIFGFFNDSTRIYDPHNTGWWYDFGFYMAVISGFGGLSLARRNRDD